MVSASASYLNRGSVEKGNSKNADFERKHPQRLETKTRHVSEARPSKLSLKSVENPKLGIPKLSYAKAQHGELHDLLGPREHGSSLVEKAMVEDLGFSWASG